MDRRHFLGATGAAAAGAVAGALPARATAAASASARPNFIVIYVDDLGYGDIGAFGGRTIATPNLDRMAKQGMALTDYYAPANLCTPSRAGFLTGRYPIRTGLARGVIMQNEKRGLPLSETTVAEALRPAYATAMVGKWHLGHVAPSWPPTAHGFDLFYGIPYSHDMLPLSLYEATANGITPMPVDYPRLQQAFHDRATRFIDDHRDRPFFLAMTLSAPHLPNYPHPDFAGKSPAGAYGDCVMEIDAIVGRILAQLERLGIAQRTQVIFTSDNGPWFEGSSGGLRQRKGGAGYDGGSRVPFLAWQPGTIPSARRVGSIAMGIDLLPTFCAMAGMPAPAGVTLDGLDITQVLRRGAASPHEQLLLFNDEDIVGLRTQQWSYVTADYYRQFLFPLEGRGYPQLYDMRDISQNYSVASLHPDVLKAMMARMAAARAAFEPLRSGPSGVLKLPPEFKEHVPDMWRD